MAWKVGQTQQMGDGLTGPLQYGFSILNQYGAPMLTLQYASEAAADKAAKAIAAAIADAVQIAPH